jgi:hypothetical protein
MNYSDNPKSRRIVLNFQDGSSQTYNHHLQGKSSWSYNDIAEVPISLDVFEKESLLYSKKIGTIESYIEFNY